MSKEHSLVIDTRNATHIFTYGSKEDAESVFDDVMKCFKEDLAFLFTPKRVFVRCEGVVSMCVVKCDEVGESE